MFSYFLFCTVLLYKNPPAGLLSILFELSCALVHKNECRVGFANSIFQLKTPYLLSPEIGKLESTIRISTTQPLFYSEKNTCVMLGFAWNDVVSTLSCSKPLDLRHEKSVAGPWIFGAKFDKITPIPGEETRKISWPNRPIDIRSLWSEGRTKFFFIWRFLRGRDW